MVKFSPAAAFLSLPWTRHAPHQQQTQGPQFLSPTITYGEKGVSEFPDDAEDPWKGGLSMFESQGNYRDDAALIEKPFGSKPLYASQGELKNLPVPSIKDSIGRLLTTALPLAEDEEEAKTFQEACDAFEEQAKVLQERLVERSEQWSDSSWLQKWWNQAGYLQLRCPTPVYISYFLHQEDDVDGDSASFPTVEGNQVCIEKAASLLKAAFEYSKTITSAEAEPDRVGKKKQLLCSTQYKYMFNTCRIPHSPQDSIRVYNPKENQHAVVACRGRFFTVPLVNAEGKPLSQATLERLLSQCVQEGSPEFEFGWLSSSDRDDWAAARDELLEIGGDNMEAALECVESALLLVSLDIDDAPMNSHEAVNQYFVGGDNGESVGKNRWWDKSVQIVVTKNGKFTFVNEHSMIDGMTHGPFHEYVREHSQKQETTDENEAADLSLKAQDVFEKATSSLSDDAKAKAKELMAKAKADYLKLNDDYDFTAINFQEFGQNRIKDTGIAADSFVQLAIQLATYRLLGKLVGTYESSQVRVFLHGRTETTRTVSPTVKAFVEAMSDGRENDEETLAERQQLMKKAAFGHVKFAAAAAKGTGVDRHFFGLSMLLKEGEKAPDLFSHPLFTRSKTWRLSTSSLDTPPGFGPVADDGFGIGYTVKDTSSLFLVSTRSDNEWTQKICEQIEQAMRDMIELAK